MVLSAWLPRHISRLLPAELNDLAVDESHLNCLGCEEGLAKCCTFWPFVPNYNVFKMRENFTLERWRELLNESLPIGLMASDRFRKAHRDPMQRPQLRCPHLSNSGRCEIWSIRPAECATYFCRSRAEESGKNFWTEVNRLAHTIEYGLSQHWMVEAGYRWSEIQKNLAILSGESGQGLSTENRSEWAHHFAERGKYFIRAERWAESLSFAGAVSLLGENYEFLLQEVKSAHALTSWAMWPRAKL